MKTAQLEQCLSDLNIDSNRPRVGRPKPVERHEAEGELAGKQGGSFRNLQNAGVNLLISRLCRIPPFFGSVYP